MARQRRVNGTSKEDEREYHLPQNDGREDSSRCHTEPSRREETRRTGVCVDAREVDVCRWHTAGKQLQAVAFGQVDVPLLLL